MLIFEKKLPSKETLGSRLVSPTGTPHFSYQPCLNAAWSPLSCLRLGLEAGYTIVNNYAHDENRIEHGVELVLSVRFKPEFPEWIRYGGGERR